MNQNKSFRDKAEAIESQLSQWRRELHANPELSFQEMETSQMVARILNQIPDMDVMTGAGYPTAIVGTLSSGEGPTFAIRADMDALPIQEENMHNYRSVLPGVMHACGHDAHTAILLGAAHVLGEGFQNGELKGTVKFLFQPAEERVDEHGLSGAQYMIQAGVLDDVDAVTALHMSPENPLGEIKVHDGYSMANVDVFEAAIYGAGGHGAYPHLGTDPVWMLASVLQALYGITGRTVSPLDPAVLSVGSIQGGAASNVIPSEIQVKGTIRSYNPTVRKSILAQLDNAFSMVKALGGNYELTIIPEDPSLKNDSVVNQFIKHSIHELYPQFTVLEVPFGMGGEDFAHMTRKVPGSMFFLGCKVLDGQDRSLHTPTFDIDEKSLSAGTAILAETTRLFLEGRKV
ncbi:M20 metallopeptidase family protein [Virgibacillus ainsalahensis]